MSEYNLLTDSEKQKITLLGLLNGHHTVTVDFQTPLKKIINSKATVVGKDFSTMRTYCTVSPTVVNLFNNKGREVLEEKIQEDLQKSINTLCELIGKKEDKISQAMFLVSFDTGYVPGNLYRIELTLQYR